MKTAHRIATLAKASQAGITEAYSEVIALRGFRRQARPQRVLTQDQQSQLLVNRATAAKLGVQAASQTFSGSSQRYELPNLWRHIAANLHHNCRSAV